MKNIILFVTTFILLSSCGKYDEGPEFSMLSKNKRLIGDWELKDVEWSTTDNYLNIVNYSFEFEKDGDFELKYEYEFEFSWGSNSTTEYLVGKNDGEWEWENDKTEIEIEFDGGGKVEYEIKKLTSKELILESDEDGSEWTFEKD